MCRFILIHALYCVHFSLQYSPCLVFFVMQENSEIGELHRENASLRYSLDEHQLAIELIMSRYREQVTQLVTRNRLDRTRLGESPDYEEVLMGSELQLLHCSCS